MGVRFGYAPVSGGCDSHDVYFFYVDESGNTGANLDDPQQPIHWLLGLGVTPVALQRAEADLLGIAVRYLRDRAYAPEFEFHGADIYQGELDFASFVPAERIRLYGEILSVIPRHGMSLFCRGIHKVRHRDRAKSKGYTPDHPQLLGFMYLTEALDEWLNERQPKPDLRGSVGDPELGLVVADEHRELDRTIVEKFSWWRRAGTEHGYRTREIRYLVDTVHYVPSRDSWMIQLADCAAYLLSRLERVREQKGWDETRWRPAEQAVGRLWATHCQERVAHHRVWPT